MKSRCAAVHSRKDTLEKLPFAKEKPMPKFRLPNGRLLQPLLGKLSQNF